MININWKNKDTYVKIVGSFIFFGLASFIDIFIKLRFIISIILEISLLLFGWLVGILLLKLKKSQWRTSLILSILFGLIGLDRLYLRKWQSAIFKFVTIGGLGIWWIIDIALILVNKTKDSEGNQLKEKVIKNCMKK